MNKSNRKSRRLLTVVLTATLLLSSLLTAQARPPLPKEIKPLAPNAPPAPALISPFDGAETTGDPDDPIVSRILYQPLGIPCFEWESVSEADEYQLQVSEIEQDTALVLDNEGLEQTVYCPTAHDLISHGIQDETRYYWRVRAEGGSPAHWGDWSPWRSFTRHWVNVPTLLLPAPEQVLVQPPVLSWTPVDGAEYYELWVSSDSNFPDVTSRDWPAFTWQLEPENVQFALATLNTGTKANHLPNDPTIYWRVRAVGAGNVDDEYRVGPWSNGGEGQVFNLCWACDMTGTSAGVDNRPKHLTPNRETDHVNSAYFSWSPVQGAAWYDLEINDTSSFVQDPASVHLLSNGKVLRVDNQGLLWEIHKDWKYLNGLFAIYWRVRAVNAYGVEAEWTSEKVNISGSFHPEPASEPRFVPISPDLLYPHFYYTPVYDHKLWEDRTISVPTFIWDRVPDATSYTLQVAKDNIFTDVVWDHPTANLSATPTSTLPFSETALYYWRVKANPQNVWSQRWETRIDQSLQVFTPTVAPPHLLYPTYREEGDGNTYGREVLEHFARLDWFPVADADHYEVQIATDVSFASPLETTETELTSYTPATYYPPDTYYWRVRAIDSGGTPLGSSEGWSAPDHFCQARHFALKWLFDADPLVDDWRDLDFTAESLLTSDPVGDQDPGAPYEQFDLTSLYTALDNNFWYFGWDVYTTTNDPAVTYQLYLDIEGADGVGMDTNPDGGALPYDDEPYEPEYVIEWNPANPTDAIRYRELGGVWNPELLSNLSGNTKLDETMLYSGTVGYAIIAVPHAIIGSPATVNALLVTIDASNNVIDAMERGYVTVSNSPLPRPVPHSRYDENGDPLYHQTPLMTWYALDNIRNPVFESAITYGFSEGSQMEQGDVPSSRTPMSNMPFAGSNPYYHPRNVYPDNVYYWRVRSRYPDLEEEDKDYGWGLNPKDDKETSWSRPANFIKQAQIPTNLTVSDANISGTLPYVSKTPLFNWDPVQGAAAYYFTLVGAQYDLTVDGTSSNYYIPTQYIPNGEYVWHVHVIDGEGNYNEDAYAEARFIKGADTPVPVFPLGSETFDELVYFEWEPLTGASYYELQVAADPNFSYLYDEYKKINNTMYVPERIPKAVALGNFYWQVCGYGGKGNFYGAFFMGCESFYLEAYTESVYLPLIMQGP